MRIVVTGGAGFIGSALCRHLVGERGVDVVNVDTLTYAANPSSLASISRRPNYRFVKADVCDRTAINALLAATRPDAIMHLAAESHVDRSIDGSSAFVQTNIVGTHVMLEAARDYWQGLPADARARFRFLHVSTDEVYGSAAEGAAFVETTAYAPRSPYAASKAAADHLAAAWRDTHGLPVLITNATNTYGPYHFPEKLIPLMVLNALELKSLPVYGDGRHVRDWLYVDDHVAALIAVLERGRVGETYCIGARAQMHNIDVVERICDLIDRRKPASRPRRDLITYVSDRPGHDRRYAIDPTKIETETGWLPMQTFASGLARTVDWYLANEAWWRPLRERVYDGARLGLAGAAPRAAAQTQAGDEP